VEQTVPFLHITGWMQYVQPSSSSVQFIFALLRATEVVTQFDSSSAPPRVTGTG
jgi:hypothetical protein